MPGDSEHDDTSALSAERVSAVILDFIDQLPALPAPLEHAIADASVARSPAFRRWASLTVGNVDRIATELGEHAVLGVAMARFVCDVFRGFNAFAAPTCDMRAFWRHAFLVAIAMDRLGERRDAEDDAPIYYATGIIHDVGQLVLCSCMPKASARVAQNSPVRCVAVHRVEVANQGFDHASIGADLLDHWRMPPDVRDAVAEHHLLTVDSPSKTETTRMSNTLQLAELIAGESPPAGAAGASHVMMESLCNRLGIEHAAVAELRREISVRAVDTDAAFDEFVCDERGSPKSAGLRPRRDSGPIEQSSWSDDQARRWFASLADLATEAMQCRRTSNLCRLVADRIGKLLDVDAVVAFIADAGGRALRCGVRDQSHLFSTTVLPDSATIARGDATIAEHESATLSRASTSARRAFIEPNRLADPVRDRFRMVFGSASQVMLPFYSGGQTVGGVLINATSAVGQQMLEAAEARGFLVSVLDSSVSRMIERERADRSRRALALANLTLQDRMFERHESRMLAAIAELAAGAAHEMNTPLAVISGRAQLLAAKVEDSQQRSELVTIDDHAKQCSQIISDLVEFAKPASPKSGLVTLKTWFAVARERWLQDHPWLRGRLTTSVADATPTVWCDGDQLASILDAIVANAAAAVSSKNGMVQINSAFGASDEIVVMSIADDGCGMSDEVFAHACDPFYSHRTAGRGRGMGLSTARRLAELNSGRLYIESQERVGTTVYVELPARAPR